MSQLKLEIIWEAEEVKLSLTDIVPRVDLSTFNLLTVTNNPASPVSLFDLPENKAIFEPYIQQVQQALRQGTSNTHNNNTKGSFIYNSTVRINKKHAYALLAHSEVFLGKALIHFCKMIGIPPWAWQIREFLFPTVGQYDQNTWILNSKTIYIGNPQVKQKDKLVYDSFWALVPHLRLVLILYLGVYWVVEIEILEDLDIPTAEHKHCIFMHTTKWKTLSSYTYSLTKVNSLLKGAEDLVVPFETWALHHIFTTLIKQQFPFVDNKMSAVVLQGQHVSGTKDGWYACDQIQRSTGLSVSSRNHQLGIGQSLQAWCGFVPASYEYSSYGAQHNIANIEENQQYTFDLARLLILQGDYHIADGDQSTHQSCVSQLMTLKPFLTRKRVDGIFALISEAPVDQPIWNRHGTAKTSGRALEMIFSLEL